MSHLTAIIITYNEASHIQACIESLSFADEVIVMDSFSTDETVALAQSAGATVLQRVFDNFAAQRNAALDSVTGRTDWVFFVDADERIPAELTEEIRRCMALPEYAAWRVPRDNYIFGKLTRWAGWYPDYQTRLLRVGQAAYDESIKVHEQVASAGPLGDLQHTLTHYNYRDVQQFLRKQHSYSRLDAQILYEQGQKPKPWSYFSMPLRHFHWRFITLKGYRDGWHGFRLSALMAWFEMRKYWILRSLWNRG